MDGFLKVRAVINKIAGVPKIGLTASGLLFGIGVMWLSSPLVGTCSENKEITKEKATEVRVEKSAERTLEQSTAGDVDLDAPSMILGGAGDADLIPLDEERQLIVSTTTSRDNRNWERKIFFHLYDNLRAIGKVGFYDPSAADPEANYCYVYAPALNKATNDRIVVTFTAYRNSKGSHCPQRTVEVIKRFQLFKVAFPVSEINELVYSTSPDQEIPLSALQSTRSSGFQWGGVGRDGLGIFKIDPFVYGNSLLFTSINLTERSLGVENIEWTANNGNLNATPVSSSLLVNGVAFNRRISEGPSAFKGPVFDYLLFQANDWGSDYSVFYKKGKGLGSINNGTAVTVLMPPVKMKKCRKDTCYHRNYGINRVFKFKDNFYIFYHTLDQNIDHAGRYIRDGWLAPLVINSKGNLVSPERLDLRLNQEKGFTYSLDLELKDGKRIENCLSNSTLPKKNKQKLFNGNCQDGRFVGVETISKLVLRASPTNISHFQTTIIPVNFWNEFYNLNLSQ